MVSDVTIELSYGDFIFDAAMYAIKIIAVLQGTLRTHKTRCGGLYMCLLRITLGYVSAKNWQNWMTSDKVITRV